MNNYTANGLQHGSVTDDVILKPPKLGTAAKWTVIDRTSLWGVLRARVAWAIASGCQLMFWQALAVSCVAADAKDSGTVSPPTYRVETEGFAASEADIRAVLDSASRELWQFFPDYEIESIVVARGRRGPITLHQRNEHGEIVMRLDTEKTYWAQYAYQFAHEFCHVLCGYRNGYRGNLWFEETLSETASLYVMRSMSRNWKTSAPYAHWADFRDALRDYVDNIVRKRDKVYEIYAKGLPEFYRAHQAELEKDPVAWELNGAMAIVLLHMFEEQPDRWEAVRWLNSTPPQEGDTFATYLQNWHDAAPAKHQPFVQKIADLFGSDKRPTSVFFPAGPSRRPILAKHLRRHEMPCQIGRAGPHATGGGLATSSENAARP